LLHDERKVSAFSGEKEAFAAQDNDMAMYEQALDC
jgi:hypothetical protein